MILSRISVCAACLAVSSTAIAAAPSSVSADLLVVGGTESGCAAVVQAARMGVKRIVLVNDIQWLGGQFSAEGLGAIDENRAAGYDGKVPIPRSGIFRDVIDAIEHKNAKLYGGVKRPGNTRVITTCRPVVAEEVFRELLAPFEKTGQVVRYSNHRVKSVVTQDGQVLGVQFESTDSRTSLTVRADLTIDATDWGDVIQGAGAAWDAGIDARSEYGEPSAPQTARPKTDLNPITWCMILVEEEKQNLFPKPDRYDARYFNGHWGWIDEEFAYSTRRLVDGHGFPSIDHPDVLLINNPSIDYPLDVYPADVVSALERTEPGASQKSLVAMTPKQREIVFEDARRHTLKYYYHLQQRFPKFRRMSLSEEFGTDDKLPPKPYVRESLRLEAQHVVREQEALGFESRSNYAATMFHDAVFSWQFEMDFHPTNRSWTTDLGNHGPWEAAFRGNRRFHRGGTGRCVFPLRALVPKSVRGLLGAQKNLGYTSIVSSSCRLHDQSIHAGQASGAVAAISLRHNVDPSELYLQPKRIEEIWAGLLETKPAAPLAIWPFADVDPYDQGFVAIQHLALRRLLGLRPSDTKFEPDTLATKAWLEKILATIDQAGYTRPPIETKPSATRRDIAMLLWAELSKQSPPTRTGIRDGDADGDGVADADDALPFTPGEISWKRDPSRDGIPEILPEGTSADSVQQFNFTTAGAKGTDGFTSDIGQSFDENRGFGWDRDMRDNNRLRDHFGDSMRDGFAFTRERATWECELANGKYLVTVCIGDASHPQPGQQLKVEGNVVFMNTETASGSFREATSEVVVRDRRLTVQLGPQISKTNTTINWLRILPIQ